MIPPLNIYRMIIHECIKYYMRTISSVKNITNNMKMVNNKLL